MDVDRNRRLPGRRNPTRTWRNWLSFYGFHPRLLVSQDSARGFRPLFSKSFAELELCVGRELRATILIGVVVLSVAGVFQIRFKSSTKRSPMAASKDVVIGHSAVNEYGKIARANPVQIRLRNFMRRSLLVEFNVHDVISVWR